MGKLDYYYSQFRTWADEFENSTMEQKKMIVCQLVKEIRVSRGYEIDIVFDMGGTSTLLFKLKKEKATYKGQVFASGDMEIIILCAEIKKMLHIRK